MRSPQVLVLIRFVSAEIKLKTPKKQKEEQTLFVPLSAKPC
jgi:hypothetical protein